MTHTSTSTIRQTISAVKRAWADMSRAQRRLTEITTGIPQR